MNRSEVFAHYRDNPEVSVLVIGGGINGIGTFRDLALQGVDVLLVEKDDFCAGASAASSHMLHGGLRYLENGEFRLVREALHERNRMLKNAPHYSKPLPTTIPIFSWFSGLLNAPLKFLDLLNKPGERGALVVKLGLTFYDWFTWSDRVMPTHKFYSKKKSLELRPHLNSNIVATVTYYDAWMPYPERICLELVLDAEAMSSQANALNYVSAEGAGANGETVILRDHLSGETLEIKPKLVVNAAGPWIDFANQALGKSTNFIGGTKGSHIVVDHPQLYEATRGHEMFFENDDGRITLFFPLQDRVLIGTTDIPIDNPDDARCTEEEIDYMLTLVRKVFPTIDVKREQIVFNFSGVRPLPASDAKTAGQISRDHSIRVTEAGNGVGFPVFSLVGGKWTTFRAFAEQTTDRVLNRLSRPRRDSTQNLAIGGGKDYPSTVNARLDWLEAVHKDTGLDRSHLSLLFERYGTRARDVATFIAAGDDALLTHVPDGYSRREISFVVQNEKVSHLDDFLLRRSLLAMLGKLNSDGLSEIGEVVGAVLGWSYDEVQTEIERAAEILKDQHGVEINVNRPQTQSTD
ncbi:MAG: glycerol-3-phosphate dehydrogenase/oxidase [Aggregatilineales bacterium]